ncbi:hypothetical protein F5Y15DRAFT_269306 [Xylariaceae sp. FL0016]|nr:hypothetical protein F5Y15DRAFT_269306 [Xylariaceae sp. FL0016]
MMPKSPPRPGKSSLRNSYSAYSLRLMPPIAETNDDPLAPPIPRRSSLRLIPPIRGGLEKPQLPFRFPGYPPPAYRVDTPSSRSTNPTISKDAEGDARGKRKPVWLINRGGWCRVLLFVVVGIAGIVGLIVGLVLGLRANSHHASNSSSNDNNDGTIIFPAGSYSFTTALTSISTSCTSNAATFRCYPYTIYSNSSTTSESASAVTYQWTISGSSSSSTSNPSYTISSTSNPFAPSFANVSAALLDRDQDTERLTFSVPLPAFAVVPAQDIDPTGADRAATCYYNDTVMSATLWTRGARASFPSDLTSSVDGGDGEAVASTDFAAWPYRVEISQTAAGGPGSGSPDCRDDGGNSVGSFEISGDEECGCWYMNYGL